MKRFICIICSVFMFTGICLGAEYPYIYKGFRPFGMGGAFVAVSDDANALFYNPAGLADIKNMRASIFPIEIEIGENAYDMYNDALDIDFDNEVETAEFLRANMGEKAHFALQTLPSFSMPRFAFCLVGTARTDLEVMDRQYPKLSTSVINDLGIGAGYGHPFLNNNLLVGGSLKYIKRQSLVEKYTVLDITSEDLDDKIQDDLEEGSGILADIGIIYKFDEMGVEGFRLGICANNLIGSELGDARDINDHVDIGCAKDFDLWITKATFAADYTDIFSQLEGDNDIAKRLRFGVEFKLPAILTVRAGFYQGYFTSGASIDAKGARLDVLTYAEEIGSYAGQRIDRRYAMRFILGF